ncbi:hypothetical protein CPter291_0005 [Collimonas pratensis]|uniref:Uncharacterized protein n=1 Tax=Collimonas pratensis TaxID=279113 RepID=A0ABN4M311_9BURK|nr:hypothetical protein CPter291_0005 [Collimonas pratensis]
MKESIDSESKYSQSTKIFEIRKGFIQEVFLLMCPVRMFFSSVYVAT